MENQNMKRLSDKDLLNVAKGLQPENEEEQKQVEISKIKSEWMEIPDLPSKKDTIEERRLKRKHIRRALFSVIKRMRRNLELDAKQMAIKDIYDDQLDPNLGLTWLGFTFSWDIHPKDHTKIIRREQWFDVGGGYDQFGAMEPTAFTEQEIS